ncbi:MAG TPA: TolC family protein [Candidatus Binatia bacterium]
MQYLSSESLRAAEIASRLAIAEADVLDARKLPNPTVSYQGTTTISGTDTIGDTIHAVSAGAPILLFGQRRARIDAALARRSASAADIADARLELVRAGRRAFAELLAAEDRVDAWKETLADIEQVQTIVVGRAEAGAKSQYDVERIRLELATDRRDLSDAIARSDSAAGDLAILVGVPGWRPHAIGSLHPHETDTDVDRLWEHAKATLPALEAATLGHDADVAEIEVARRESYPVPQVTVGEQSTTDPHGVAISAGISIPLPVFDRNQGEIARKAAEARNSGIQLDVTMREARARLETAVAVLRTRREALAAFERDATAQVPRLKQMAHAFYDSGEGNIVDLLDALKAIGEARLDRIDLVDALVPAELDVEAAAGLDVDGVESGAEPGALAVPGSKSSTGTGAARAAASVSN